MRRSISVAQNIQVNHVSRMNNVNILRAAILLYILTQQHRKIGQQIDRRLKNKIKCLRKELDRGTVWKTNSTIQSLRAEMTTIWG